MNIIIIVIIKRLPIASYHQQNSQNTCCPNQKIKQKSQEAFEKIREMVVGYIDDDDDDSSHGSVSHDPQVRENFPSEGHRRREKERPRRAHSFFWNANASIEPSAVTEMALVSECEREATTSLARRLSIFCWHLLVACFAFPFASLGLLVAVAIAVDDSDGDAVGVGIAV